MADILIRGFEMPTTGNYFAMVENEQNHAPNVTIWKRKADGGLESFGFGEIIELPEHGDLIDRSKLSFVCGGTAPMGMDYVRRYVVDGMPVIIPASEEKGGV